MSSQCLQKRDHAVLLVYDLSLFCRLTIDMNIFQNVISDSRPRFRRTEVLSLSHAHSMGTWAVTVLTRSGTAATTVFCVHTYVLS